MRVLRWLAPSAVAACVGALVAGLGEGRGLGGGVVTLAATAGFLAVLAIPALLAASVVVRGLLAAWRPGEVAARLTEPDGSAPRLVGWIVMLGLGALALAYAVHRGTWWLAAVTAFKPVTVGLATPVITVAAVLVLVAVSRPVARLGAAVAQRVDARWRRSGRPTLLRPARVVAATGLAGLVVVTAAWHLVVRPRLGPLDTSIAYAPAAGLLATLGVHLGWRRLPRPALVGGGVALIAAGVIATALLGTRVRPAMTLEIWGDRPLTGVVIDALFDLDAVRGNIDLAAFRPVASSGSPHPDIILVTIDTVRADHTPPYGGAASMPTLAALGERGAVFTWALAPSNVTRRSIPSMVIGSAPNRIRGRVVGWALRVDPRHVLLAERLRAGGYETAGFMCCDGFWGARGRTGLQRGLEHLEIEPLGAKLGRRAEAWLTAREARGERRPLFVWVHLIEPHNWAVGLGEPSDDPQRARAYDRTLAASDLILADVLRPLMHRAPEQAPIVIVTSDHAEALGEHATPYHSTDLYNSQLRVPLVIAGPGIPAQHLLETVSLTDLVPTIVELAGFAPPRGPSIDGRSLADLLTGRRPADPEQGPAFAAMIKDRSNPGGVLAVARGRWKLIETGDRLELYDIHADPGELTNLVDARPEVLAELRALLEQRKAAARVSPFD